MVSPNGTLRGTFDLKNSKDHPFLYRTEDGWGFNDDEVSPELDRMLERELGEKVEEYGDNHFEVDYFLHPGEQQTRDCPGEPEQFEFGDWKFMAEPVTAELDTLLTEELGEQTETLIRAELEENEDYDS